MSYEAAGRIAESIFGAAIIVGIALIVSAVLIARAIRSSRARSGAEPMPPLR